MARHAPRLAVLALGAAILSALPIATAEAQYYPRRHNPGAA
jgi:hypothetical protein